MVKIYKLIDPRSMEIRYIGATSGSLKSRLSGHLWDSRNLKGTYKINWINSLTKLKLKPIIELIEETLHWQEREKYWYTFYKDKCILVNSTSGGEGVFKKDKNSIFRSSSAKFVKIKQFDLNLKFIKDWESIKEATVYYGYSRNAIKNNLRGRSASSGGFIWKYKEKDTPKSNRKPTPNKIHK